MTTGQRGRRFSATPRQRRERATTTRVFPQRSALSSGATRKTHDLEGRSWASAVSHPFARCELQRSPEISGAGHSVPPPPIDGCSHQYPSTRARHAPMSFWCLGWQHELRLCLQADYLSVKHPRALLCVVVVLVVVLVVLVVVFRCPAKMLAPMTSPCHRTTLYRKGPRHRSLLDLQFL